MKPNSARESSRIDGIFTLLIALMLICYGLGLAGWWFVTRAKTRNMVQTQGMVVSSVVMRSGTGVRTHPSQVVKYLYSYQGSWYNNQKQPDKTERYRFGDRVTVWVDPNHPSDSVLYRPSLLELLTWLMVVSLGMTLMGFEVENVFLQLRKMPIGSLAMQKLKPLFPVSDWQMLFMALPASGCFSVFFVIILYLVKRNWIDRIYSLLLPFIGVSALVVFMVAVDVVKRLRRYLSRVPCELSVTCASVRSGERMQLNYAFAAGCKITRLEVLVRSINLETRPVRKGDPDPVSGVEVSVWQNRPSEEVPSVGSCSFDLPTMPSAGRRSWSLILKQEDSSGSTVETEYLLCK